MRQPVWYTKKSWSIADREDFLTRLRATPGEHEQAAALRKQAGHLLKQGDSEQLLAGARELYELFLDQFPASAERAYVLGALGEIHERIGEPDAAFARWREALSAQRGTPRSTNAQLRFGLLAVGLQRTDLYAEVLALLDEFTQTLIYPLDQYQHCGIKAHVHSHRGNRAAAMLCAGDALSAAKHIPIDETSAFHRLLLDLVSHSKLGTP